MSAWEEALEDRGRRQHEDESLIAPGQFGAEGRRERAVKTETEAVVVPQPVEVEIGGAGGHLARVEEHRGVEETVDHDAPLTLEQQAVPIPEAQACIAPQGGTAAKRGQHEE